MQIRKYIAKSMQEAIGRVKDDLGPDAVILTSKTVRAKSGKTVLEVTAAVDYDRDALLKAVREKKAQQSVETSTNSESAMISPAGKQTADLMRSIQTVETRLERLETGSNLDALLRKINGIDTLVNDMAQMMSAANGEREVPIFTGEEAKLFQQLLGSGMDQGMAVSLMKETQNHLAANRLDASTHGTGILADTLMNKVPLLNKVKSGRRVVALVGPTGMGKTTTIAKLAADELFSRKRSIGFVTIDTFRIGAVDQLRAYANILQTPVEVARNENELVKKVESMPDADTIFVDTAGISPRDNRMIANLSLYFKTGLDIETHLVLSASTRLDDLQMMTDRFSVLPLSSIIISKIDEVTRLGNIFSFISKAELPLSYFTTGQNVPDDIEPATAERLADMVLGISTAA